MKSKNSWLLVAILGLIFFSTSCRKTALPGDENNSLINNASQAGIDASASYDQSTVNVFATGLNNPRGLKFGPDGQLYVAEGGIGGTNSTIGTCTQVPFPIGPYTGSTTGARISRISRNGVRHTVSDQFPSSTSNELTGGDIQGVADIAFIGDDLYAVLSGAGCSHGVANIPNAVVKLRPNGTWTTVADLSSWFQNHPVLNPEPDDFEPDGTPYSMINVGGVLYVMEANHGELLKISNNGHISRVVDISASQGHIVPTAMIYDNQFIFGNLHPFPIVDGSSNIYKLTHSGQVEILAAGFTTVLGVCEDHWGNLYVLQNTTGNMFPTPGTGNIIRMNRNGSREIIASGLIVPTGMTFGPDGKLYVSNVGFGPNAIGGGQILQISVRRSHENEDR